MVNRDILFGFVKRLVKMRVFKLKVLVIFATFDGEKVLVFFFGCFVLNVLGKLYFVEIFFSNECLKSYFESVLKRVIGMVLILLYNFLFIEELLLLW